MGSILRYPERLSYLSFTGITPALLLLILSFLFPSSARSQVFNFNGSNASSWRFENARAARLQDGGVLLNADGVLRVGVPQAEGMTLPANALDLTLCARDPVMGAVFIKFSDGAEAIRLLNISGGPGERCQVKTHTIYLGDAGGLSGISGFALEFRGMGPLEIKLDSIKFYEASGTGLLRAIANVFLEPDFITLLTINHVATPSMGQMSFLAALYDVIILVTGVVAIFLIIRKSPRAKDALIKTVIVSFAVCGFLFTLRMDYNWVSIWRSEFKTLHGKGVDEKIRAVNGYGLYGFFDFIDFIKRKVPAGKKVRPAALSHEERLAAMGRHYLLPLKTSDSADFIWTYRMADLRYDPSDGTIKRGGSVVEKNVRLYAKFDENAAIYEVIR